MNLDEDVVFQIQLRFPVRSLLRFRCVSKEWCDRIDSRVFKDSYLARRRSMDVIDDQLLGLKTTLISSNDIPYEEMELVLDNDKDGLRRTLEMDIREGISTISVTCWYDDYQSVALSALLPLSLFRDFEISDFYSGGGFGIINHVDGIVCFFNGYNWFDISLVNPALREFRKLPIPLLDLGGYRCESSGIGFGYDDVSDDYKVVAIVDVYQEQWSCDCEHIGVVYSLSTNSWQILGDMSEFLPPCFINYFSYESVFTNGSIHWCLQWKNNEPVFGILAFDVANELFRKIPFPLGWKVCFWSDIDAMLPHLFMYGKSTIALVGFTNYLFRGIQEIEVWVMEEYGDSDSWTKLYSISCAPKIKVPLSFWKKDKLLLEKHGSPIRELICYDISRGELDHAPEQCYPIQKKHRIRDVHFITGHESFVSIKQA